MNSQEILINLWSKIWIWIEHTEPNLGDTGKVSMGYRWSLFMALFKIDLSWNPVASLLPIFKSYQTDLKKCTKIFRIALFIIVKPRKR